MKAEELLDSVRSSKTTGAFDSALSDFESLLGIPVSGELRNWLLLGEPFEGRDFILFSLSAPADYLDICKRQVLEPHWVQAGWIPLGGDGLGNYFLAIPSTKYGWAIGFLDATANMPDELEIILSSSVKRFIEYVLTLEISKDPIDFEYSDIVVEDKFRDQLQLDFSDILAS